MRLTAVPAPSKGRGQSAALVRLTGAGAASGSSERDGKMRKFPRITSARLLLVIVAVAAAGLAGYRVANHKPGPGVYTYRGYIFPDMPSSFVTAGPIPGALFPYATVFYRTSGTLGAIEAQIGNVCEDDKYYYPPGAWGSIGSSGDGYSYSAAAGGCSTKNGASRWQFDISAGTTTGTYDVAISSEGPPVPV